MKHLVRATVFSLAVLAVFLSPPLCGRAAAPVEQMRALDSGLTVHVQEASGEPILVEAVVTLTSSEGSGIQTEVTHQGGVADFTRISPGDYTIQVTAPGYRTARDDVNVSKGGTTETFISLNPAGQSAGAKPYPGVPLLAGKARKELEAAIESLQANHAAEASAHIANALRRAPAHPDVQYVAGLCALAQRNSAAAQKYYETAIGIYPNHLGAQIGLGALLLQQHDAAGAVTHLEKALSIDPSNWRAHWLIAEAYLSAEHDAAKAKSHANRAIELGGDKAVDAQVTLARAEIMAGERDAARNRLQKFVRDYPNHSSVPRAQELLRELDTAPAVPPAQ
jgi:Flp pilus assembly protein TadD